MEFVMTHVDKNIRENGLLSSGIRNVGCLPISESDALFAEAYDILIAQLYGDNMSGRSRRANKKTVGRIYNLIPNPKKRRERRRVESPEP